MDRVFLDANVLFSAAYVEISGLTRLWTFDNVALLSSAYAIEEARRNLAIDRPDSLPRFRRLLDSVLTVRRTAGPETPRPRAA